MNWILWIVVFVSPTESHTQALQTYETKAECDAEDQRITAEMKAYYPVEEHNFVLMCLPPIKEWE